MDASYEDIVSSSSSPTLVLAGPGSGKTYMMSDRVKRLLEAGVPKERITVLAFGVDAAVSMKQKLTDKESDFRLRHEDLPRIDTIHALGFEIVREKLRQFGLRRNGLAVQSNDLVKKLLFRDAALVSGLTEADGEVAREAKAREMVSTTDDRIELKICKAYWSIMSKCNAIDFDDQVLFACDVLERDASILGRFQDGCHHLLVDEYQDINAAQCELIAKLSRKAPKGLFVVGDDAQSIYAFRGATPAFILKFADWYECAQTFPLAQSRRCPKCIMEPSFEVLRQFYPEWTGPMNLTYHRDGRNPPEVWQLPSEKAGAEWTARLARDAISKRKSVLVLAPKKELFVGISRMLRQFNIAHECPAEILPRNTAARLSQIKALVDWVQNPDDNLLTRVAVETVLNHGPKKVPGARKTKTTSAETIDRRIKAEVEIAALWEHVSSRSSLNEVLQKAEMDTVSGSICETLQSLSKSFAAAGKWERGEFAKNLSIASGAWTTPQHVVDDLSSALTQLSPRRASGPGFVQLMTMRKAKGLEADVVIVVGLEDDLIPIASDPAEEARLMYVSMTRAKEQLFLFHAYSRPRDITYGQEIRDKPRSKFLDATKLKSKYIKP